MLFKNERVAAEGVHFLRNSNFIYFKLLFAVPSAVREAESIESYLIHKFSTHQPIHMFQRKLVGTQLVVSKDELLSEQTDTVDNGELASRT